MAKLTVEKIYHGDKYNIMGNVLKKLMSLFERTGTLEDLQTATELLVRRHTLIAVKKMIEEGDSISGIPEVQLPSLCKEGK